MTCEDTVRMTFERDNKYILSELILQKIQSIEISVFLLVIVRCQAFFGDA